MNSWKDVASIRKSQLLDTGCLSRRNANTPLKCISAAFPVPNLVPNWAPCQRVGHEKFGTAGIAKLYVMLTFPEKSVTSPILRGSCQFGRAGALCQDMNAAND